MNLVCNIVAERVALGESLGDHAAHVTTCERCQRVVALPATLALAHRDVEPGMGFAARMTVGAQQRLLIRRRRRVVGAVGVSLAAASVVLLVTTRSTETTQPVPAVAIQEPAHPDAKSAARADAGDAPDNAPADNGSDDADAAPADADLAMLVNYANTARGKHASADWRHITRPLRPYKYLLKGIKP